MIYTLATALLVSQALAQDAYWAQRVGLETHVHRDDGCVTDLSDDNAGKHKYSSRLNDIPSGADGRTTCETTPHTLAGVVYDGPETCTRSIFTGWTGEWFIPDTKCEAAIGNQPGFTRGEDDELRREGPLNGYIDMHAHLMSNLGFGGVVFSGAPYGEPDEALPDCPSAGIFEPNLGGHSRVEAILLDDILGGALNTARHDNEGNPVYNYWPRANTYTHQAIYYQWLKRAYEGGMRAIISPCVNGDFMFGTSDNGLPDIIQGIPLASNPIYSLDDMDTLRRQVLAMRAMEAWIDNRNGGPGEGWFRLVYTPEQYRQVVADGKLAVILATEVDYPLNCRPGTCTEAQIAAGVEELWDLGIRYVFPIHLKTNDFGGAGKYNILVAADTYDCPSYSGECNQLGLTNNGEFLMHTLMNKGMIIDIGHHGRLAFDEALEVAELAQYPGMAVGHAWFYDIIHSGGRTEITHQTSQMERIIALGGMIGIIGGQGPIDWVAEYHPKDDADTFIPHGCGESSQSFAQAYLFIKDVLGDAAYDGRMTIGTDFNGFAHMPGARFGDSACYGGDSDMIQPESSRVQYPFTVDPALVPAATTGADPEFDLYTFGERTFDFNTDGAAHMGMMPDFWEDLRQQGMKRSDLEPLYRSADYYATMWEAAIVRSVQLSGTSATLSNLKTSAKFVLRSAASSPAAIVAVSVLFVLAALGAVVYLRRRDAAKRQRQTRDPLLMLDRVDVY